MNNPYVKMQTPTIANPQGEEVSGTFFCQEKGCDGVAIEARYIPEVKVLTWKPNCEHVGVIEGYVL